MTVPGVVPTGGTVEIGEALKSVPVPLKGTSEVTYEAGVATM